MSFLHMTSDLNETFSSTHLQLTGCSVNLRGGCGLESRLVQPAWHRQHSFVQSLWVHLCSWFWWSVRTWEVVWMQPFLPHDWLNPQVSYKATGVPIKVASEYHLFFPEELSLLSGSGPVYCSGPVFECPLPECSPGCFCAYFNSFKKHIITLYHDS